MWNQEEVIALRTRLGVERSLFARITGVDVRTVTRWETGKARPTGAAEAVLDGLREKLRVDPDSAGEVIKFVVNTCSVGGLAYLIVRLLDAQTKPARRS